MLPYDEQLKAQEVYNSILRGEQIKSDISANTALVALQGVKYAIAQEDLEQAKFKTSHLESDRNRKNLRDSRELRLINARIDEAKERVRASKERPSEIAKTVNGIVKGVAVAGGSALLLSRVPFAGKAAKFVVKGAKFVRKVAK